MKKNCTSATVKMALRTIGKPMDEERPEDARAVEGRGLEDLPRDGPEVGGHHEHGQRQADRGVGDDERPERSGEAGLEVDGEQRQQDHLSAAP